MNLKELGKILNLIPCLFEFYQFISDSVFDFCFWNDAFVDGLIDGG